MSSKKSCIKNVLRQHYPSAFFNAPKLASDGKTWIVPSRRSLQGTRAATTTTLIVDLSIYANMFANVVPNPKGPGKIFMRRTGTEFVQALTKNIREGFDEGYRTVVLVLDKAVHTTEAKALTQSARSESAKADCLAAGVQPTSWNEDDPTDLVTADGVLEPMCAIKCVRSAFRYALYQAMELELRQRQLDVPNGCQVIIDIQPYDATNPATPARWLEDPRIVIWADSRELVERYREQLVGPGWRAKARELSTELGRAGAFMTLPWCIATTDLGIRLAPYVLPNCGNTCGEADLAVWRWVALMFGENARHSLNAPRHAAVDGALCTEEQTIVVGPACVATVDSDFQCAGLVATTALISDYMHKMQLAHGDYTNIDAVGNLAPFLLTGESYVTTVGYVSSFEQYGSIAEMKKPGSRALRKCYELMDMHRFFCSVMFDRYPYKRARDAVDDPEMTPSPLPPFVLATSTPHQWLQRALTLLAYRAISGNDFLAGLCGIVHTTMWKALCALMRDVPGTELVHFSKSFMRPYDSVCGVLPSQAAVLLHPEMYTRFVTYCYWASIADKPGKFKPQAPAKQFSLVDISALVAAKWKASPKYHVPKTATLALMYERALWCIYYEFYGPHSVRRTLDENVVGWYPAVKDTKV